MKSILPVAIILNLISALFNAYTAQSTLGLIIAGACLLIACLCYGKLRKG